MMPDIMEFAEKHKDEVIKRLRDIESEDKAMKSNKVRMNISRDMHEWFKEIEGKTNDERMQRVIEVNDDYKQLLIDKHELNKLYMKRGQSLISMMQTSGKYQELYHASRSNNRILKRLLALSTAISIASVSYLAYVQGWFL